MATEGIKLFNQISDSEHNPEIAPYDDNTTQGIHGVDNRVMEGNRSQTG